MNPRLFQRFAYRLISGFGEDFFLQDGQLLKNAGIGVFGFLSVMQARFYATFHYFTPGSDRRKRYSGLRLTCTSRERPGQRCCMPGRRGK